MKKLIFSFAGFIILSCTHHDVMMENPQIDYKSLNTAGQQFIDALTIPSDWEQKWQPLFDIGTPLPNEAVCLSKVTSDGLSTYCVIPVVLNKKIVRLVFYNVIYSDDGTVRLDLREILDNEGIQQSRYARRFVAMKPFRAWIEKGYELELELKPLPPKEGTTREGNGKSFFDFDVIFYHELSSNPDKLRLLIESGYRMIMRFRVEMPNQVYNVVAHVIKSYFPSTYTQFKLEIHGDGNYSNHVGFAGYFFMELRLYLLSQIPYQAHVHNLWIVHEYKEGIYTDDEDNYTLGQQPKPGEYSESIFRNLTVDEKKKLDRLLEVIMNDCAGRKIFSGLVWFLGSSRIDFEFDESLGNGGIAEFDKVQIRIGPEAKSHTLMEELFHYYQILSIGMKNGGNADYYTQSALNREVEAHVASTMYKYRNSENITPYIPSWEKACLKLIKNMDNKGDFIDNSAAKQTEHAKLLKKIRNKLKNMYGGTTPYANMSWASYESPLSLLKFLRQIAKDC